MVILLLHNVEHFIFSVYPTETGNWLAVLDKGVLNVSFALFGGKAYAIFSLLFGFTLPYNIPGRGNRAETSATASSGVSWDLRSSLRPMRPSSQEVTY